ncbi:hypothetical protein KI387_014482, partial [Taxus chinensis]
MRLIFRVTMLRSMQVRRMVVMMQLINEILSYKKGFDDATNFEILNHKNGCVKENLSKIPTSKSAGRGKYLDYNLRYILDILLLYHNLSLSYFDFGTNITGVLNQDVL